MLNRHFASLAYLVNGAKCKIRTVVFLDVLEDLVFAACASLAITLILESMRIDAEYDNLHFENELYDLTNDDFECTLAAEFEGDN